MSTKFDLTKEDLYGILGVNEDATDKAIVKAYRKQALKCHPDKNPDNKAAAEEFHRLSQALEVLTDPAAKAAYDNIIKAKKATQLRQKQYDSKRKKFKDDLDERERAAGNQRHDELSAATKLRAEIDRLRKEGNRILKETQEQLNREMQERLAEQRYDSDSDNETTSAKIKAKWKIKKGDTRDDGYTKEDLMDIFTQYGHVYNLVLSIKKSGTAIIEFSSPIAANLAVQNETGKSEFPLTLTWLSGQPENVEKNRNEPRSNEAKISEEVPSQTKGHMDAFQKFSPGQRTVDNKDYESLVLMKMRQAEERKRLMEEMLKEDEEGR